MDKIKNKLNDPLNKWLEQRAIYSSLNYIKKDKGSFSEKLNNYFTIFKSKFHKKNTIEQIPQKSSVYDHDSETFHIFLEYMKNGQEVSTRIKSLEYVNKNLDKLGFDAKLHCISKIPQKIVSYGEEELKKEMKEISDWVELDKYIANKMVFISKLDDILDIAYGIIAFSNKYELQLNKKEIDNFVFDVLIDKISKLENKNNYLFSIINSIQNLKSH